MLEIGNLPPEKFRRKLKNNKPSETLETEIELVDNGGRIPGYTAIESVGDLPDLNEVLIKDQESTILVRMCSDAMKDLAIQQGDVLVIDCNPTKKISGKIAVVKHKNRFLVRRLYKTFKELLLVAANKEHEPIKIKGNMNDVVWGIVDCVIRKI